MLTQGLLDVYLRGKAWLREQGEKGAANNRASGSSSRLSVLPPRHGAGKGENSAIVRLI